MLSTLSTNSRSIYARALKRESLTQWATIDRRGWQGHKLGGTSAKRHDDMYL